MYSVILHTDRWKWFCGDIHRLLVKRFVLSIFLNNTICNVNKPSSLIIRYVVSCIQI